MPRARVRFAPAALRDLERLREFLHSKSPQAAVRAAAAITTAIKRLEQHPQMGRLVEDMPPEYRELPIDFGASGYVALYRYDASKEKLLTVLAVRHQREAGYY